MPPNCTENLVLSNFHNATLRLIIVFGAMSVNKVIS